MFPAVRCYSGGNSGSGVFDTSGMLIGVLARGQPDSVLQGNCNVVNAIPCDDDATCDGQEAITYAFNALAVAIDCFSDENCGEHGLCDRQCPTDSAACTGWCYNTSVPQPPAPRRNDQHGYGNSMYLLIMFLAGLAAGYAILTMHGFSLDASNGK
eukprot:c18768_g1_i1.p1 GENE.c18768_g1_i1~~c18768_g1_i1.p1  ORF type:complete len:155 (-),score=21.76 c18768_g1_i1:51-515(-)